MHAFVLRIVSRGRVPFLQHLPPHSFTEQWPLIDRLRVIRSFLIQSTHL
jgi:hypothetical protein